MGLVIGALSASAEVRIEKLDRDIYRVRMDRGGVFADSLLNRYGAIEKLSPEPVAALPDGCALPEMKQTETGFELAFRLADGERLYGLGDVLRDRLNRRGGLFVRAGAIIPMWSGAQYVEKGWSDSVELHLWPGDGEGELYEDDGDTLEYREGRGCLTKFAVKDGEFRVTDIRGEFTLMPKSGRQFKLIRHEVK